MYDESLIKIYEENNKNVLKKNFGAMCNQNLTRIKIFRIRYFRQKQILYCYKLMLAETDMIKMKRKFVRQQIFKKTETLFLRHLVCPALTNFFPLGDFMKLSLLKKVKILTIQAAEILQ